MSTDRSHRRAPRRRALLALGGVLLCSVLPLTVSTVAHAEPVSGPVQPSTVSPSSQRLDAWWFDAMHLPAAHRETTGKGVTVALIDTALDPTVPDLRGADVELRTDCNGHQEKPVRGAASDHGTAMATLIAGQGHGNAAGGRGILGVAPDVRLRFYSADYNPSTKRIDCDEFQTGAMMVRAAKEGADLISISIGGSGNYDKYLRQVLAMGVPVVASTGDSRDSFKGQVEMPAGFPGVVGVNAVDREAKPWAYNPAPYLSSRFQEFPVISAPGVEVTNGAYQQGRGWVSDQTRTGTSDATAIVAGGLALVKAKYPGATGNQLIQTLVHDTGGTRPYKWDRYFGFGIVSVQEMLSHDPTEWPDVNPLLGGPAKAVRDFPASVRGAGSSAGGSPSSSSSPAPSASTSPAAADASNQDDGGGGVPGGVLLVGALLALASLAAGAVTISKRGSRPVATDDNAKGV